MAADAPASAEAVPREVVEQVMQGFESSYNNNDTTAAASAYSTETLVTVNGGIENGGPFTGKQPTEVAAFLDSLRNQMGGTNIKFTVTEVAGNTHKDTWTSDAGTGTCFATWAKDADGAWKITKDEITFTPKAAPEAAAPSAEAALAAAADEDSDDMEIPAAPPLHGHLHKQSPAMLRLRGWDIRFFLVADMKLMWWTNMQDCLTKLASQDTAQLIRRVSTSDHDVATTSKKGMINFELTGAVIKAEPGSDTIFSIAPPGQWARGSTTDIRDDDKRVYKFDTKQSEHPRERWMEMLQEHIKKGEEMRTSGNARISECWEDATISDDQLAAAARLVKKLEARKRR